MAMSLHDLITFFFCFFPSLLLLLFIRSQHPGHREPPSRLALTFAMGMVAAAIAFFAFEDLESLRIYGPLLSGNSTQNTLEEAAFYLAVVGPIEETLKLSALVASTWFTGFSFSPGAGLVYAAASALGFATAENFYAMWATGGPDPGRAATVPFLHMVFSAFCGWGVGESARKGGASWPVYLGLALASAYHGLYNFLACRGGLLYFLTLPLVGLLWLFLTWAMRDLWRPYPPGPKANPTTQD